MKNQRIRRASIITDWIKVAQKRKRYKNNMSGYKGVSPEFYVWESLSKNPFDEDERKLRTGLKWRVKIKYGGRQLSYGLWKSKKQAARVYNLLATTLFGNHCYINKNVGKITDKEKEIVKEKTIKYLEKYKW